MKTVSDFPTTAHSCSKTDERTDRNYLHKENVNNVFVIFNDFFINFYLSFFYYYGIIKVGIFHEKS